MPEAGAITATRLATRFHPLTVGCRTCGAEPSVRCTAYDVEMVFHVHTSRFWDATRSLAVPVDKGCIA